MLLTPTKTEVIKDESTFKIQDVRKQLGNAKLKGHGDGAQQLEELDQFKQAIESALVLSGAPTTFTELLDTNISEPRTDKYSETANKQLYAILFLSTEGTANSVCQQYKETKDGRLAWLNINANLLPNNSLARCALVRKIANFQLLRKSDPGPQLDELQRTQTSYASARCSPLVEYEITDAIINTISMSDTEIYGNVTTVLNKMSMEGEPVTYPAGRALAVQAFTTHTFKTKANLDDSTRANLDHSSTSRKKGTSLAISPSSLPATAWKQRAESFHDKQIPQEKKLPFCTICKAKGATGMRHFHDNCPLLAQLTVPGEGAVLHASAKSISFDLPEEVEDSDEDLLEELHW